MSEIFIRIIFCKSYAKFCKHRSKDSPLGTFIAIIPNFDDFQVHLRYFWFWGT